jgi:Alpha/beta hydrolase domain
MTAVSPAVLRRGALAPAVVLLLDVPVATHQALNEPRDPDQDLTPGSCLVYGSQLDFPGDELASLYGDRETYLDEVDDRLDELLEDGWMLEQFADDLRQQAAAAVDRFDG